MHYLAVPNWANVALLLVTAAVCFIWGRTPERVISGAYLAGWIVSHFDGLWRLGNLIWDFGCLALIAPFAWRDRRYAIFWSFMLYALTCLNDLVGVALDRGVSWYAFLSIGNSLGYVTFVLLIIATWQAQAERRLERNAVAA